MILRAVRYALDNPRYFARYFVGGPDRLLSLVGPGTFREYRAEMPPSQEGYWQRRQCAFLYALVRALGPKRVVETGVFEGVFSTAILQGLHDNGFGRLVSIDLPAREPIQGSTSLYRTKNMRAHCLPPGRWPGWRIPDHLLSRWKLHLGDSRRWLRPVLEDLGTIDLFFHDSLHTYDHMTWEYETAWPYLTGRGLLVSHDIHWNRAFLDMAGRHNRTDYACWGFGVLRKEKP